MENEFDSATIGNIATRSIDTNLSGHPVPAHIGQIFIGDDVEDAEAIIIDAGEDAKAGVAFRRYMGMPALPLPVGSGNQLGYFDFRGFSGTQMWNTASLDAVIDGAVGFGPGDLPPAKIRIATADTDAGAKSRLEITATGRVEIGAAEGVPLGSLGNPTLFVSQAANDWAALLSGHPGSGTNYNLRVHLSGQSESDIFIVGSSGAVLGTFKFMAYGNGDIDIAGNISVDSKKVIGAQLGAVANATDETSLVTQVNALLARCREHGLIAS